GGEILFDKEKCKIVKDVHLQYLISGADIITTATYQISLPAAILLANEARNEFLEKNKTKRKPLIALSLGCYGAFLANGSEYTGNYGNVTEDEVYNFHLERLKTFLNFENFNDFIDILAFETIPNAFEVKVLKNLFQNFDLMK
ncbi:Homocysteine S-methyltransferase 1, partial [Clydaea vesicula]